MRRTDRFGKVGDSDPGGEFQGWRLSQCYGSVVQRLCERLYFGVTEVEVEGKDTKGPSYLKIYL